MSALDRLSIELDAGRFEADATEALIEQLGPVGRLFRALTQARRRRWAGARLDALAVPEGDPLHDFVAGHVLFVARDYQGALQRLGRAANATHPPALALQAGELVIRLSGELGWLEEQRSAWSRLGQRLRLPLDVQRRLDTGRQRREQAETRRATELLDMPIEQAAKRAFARLALDGADPALRSFAALRERHGPAAALLGEQVRLELVLGRLDRAAALLDECSAADLERFAGVRASLALARGDLDQTIVRTTHHRGDPWLLLLRGEALEHAGEFTEASKLLERARARAPDSVAITLALALARHRGEADVLSEALEQRFVQLLAWAPALLADAGRIVGVEPWTDQGSIRDREAMVAILANARALLTADRDPWTSSYRIGAGPLRLLAPAAAEDHLARLHRDDADRAKIEQAERALFRSIGHRPTATARPSGPEIQVVRWQPSALRPDEIEQFLVDGYLVVRGCFDPRTSEQWIADANRRIREEPERWVKNYTRNEARNLADYDPARPETWTWPRIDLEGSQMVEVEQFAPRGWAAICDLLGGPERIKTRTWTNYLIANFNADAHLDVPGPGPDWTSWHIDDPSPVTRLDRIANGLVGIAIHSPLRPRSGGTWLAPDSVGRVAKLLAAHPEGVDFCSGRGAGVTRQCKRFVEVTGEVGDLLLMHPLMMHSSSPNPSGRIRWMGNPMVYLEQPLAPLADHAQLSPVELAIRRAIDAEPNIGPA